ncbi:hypothetical protein DZB91_18795 [Brevibacillus sp. VP]|nr:hypothetical protein DZB91_18795 [Brevibacillus sp. VP]
MIGESRHFFVKVNQMLKHGLMGALDMDPNIASGFVEDPVFRINDPFLNLFPAKQTDVMVLILCVPRFQLFQRRIAEHL